ncbi:13506_t:CDS:2 [Cetraspora pellucida]|uniref:13506_t:CDS:1 n=1 Tax=Cetraspora pellucida TaxID=1433469 RepID=A0A9N9ES64_9GLOM|nr:13506_t:CDS:2 [Cetraspora pellucida]
MKEKEKKRRERKEIKYSYALKKKSKGHYRIKEYSDFMDLDEKEAYEEYEDKNDSCSLITNCGNKNKHILTPQSSTEHLSKDDKASKSKTRPFTMDITNLLSAPDDESSSSTTEVATPSPPTTPDPTTTSLSSERLHKIKLKNSGNSLSRVLIDRGLTDQTFGSVELNNNNNNSIRLSSTPHLEWEDLIKNINDLNLDMSNLDNITLNVKWKSNPLEISHLLRYDVLHKTEATVASLLRLTPVQYLTSKYILLSASRRYKDRMLPFRKSDAQKMLKIDVNKSSKLWEFFGQANWL